MGVVARGWEGGCGIVGAEGLDRSELLVEVRRRGCVLEGPAEVVGVGGCSLLVGLVAAVGYMLETAGSDRSVVSCLVADMGHRSLGVVVVGSTSRMRREVAAVRTLDSAAHILDSTEAVDGRSYPAVSDLALLLVVEAQACCSSAHSIRYVVEAAVARSGRASALLARARRACVSSRASAMGLAYGSGE